MSDLTRTIDGQTFGPAVTIEGGEEPAMRVYARWGLPKKEPKLSAAVAEMATDDPEAFARLKAEIRAERTQGQPVSDEFYEEWRERQAEAEAQEVAAAAERAQVAEEIRSQFGDTLLARKMAAQVGVDLDRD